MTQFDLSAKTGLSRASIANIERGQQNVGLHHLYSIATALEVSTVSDLLPPLGMAKEKREAKTMTRTNEVLSETSKAAVDQIIRSALRQADNQSR